MKKFTLTSICYLFSSVLFVGTLIYPAALAFGAGQPLRAIEIMSSLNPVGSGARAIGRGGAFIGVADDATAASWNPGGLVQLKRKPEISLVFAGFNRHEDNHFGAQPESSGLNSVSGEDINYASIAGTFELFNRNMSLALAYQHLYDFTREWNLIVGDNYWHYRQEGKLSALGLSYCIQIIPELSFGITLNFWKDGMTDNYWEQKDHVIKSDGKIGSNSIEEYSFKGFNFNLGMLYCLNKKLTIGAVLKTPFKADIEHKVSGQYYDYIWDEEIEMPMSYGIGFAYNVSDKLSVSADIYKTEWNDFIYRYRDEGDNEERNPISGLPVSQSDMDSTHQIRIGVEYIFLNKSKRYVIPVRCGIFYDPAPAEKSPDDFYGLTFGIGLTKIDWFSLDVAYQYRFGNNVGTSYMDHLQFSQDIHEHMIYASMILYRF